MLKTKTSSSQGLRTSSITPNEVLRKIFLAALENRFTRTCSTQPLFGRSRTHFIDDVPHVSLPVAPWRLALVCRQWRDVALATPQLWTAVHAHYPSDHLSFTYDAVAPMLALRTQLERAGKANLHLSVQWGDNLRGYDLGHFCALLRHALTHAERITELTISFESLNNTRIFGYFTATEFPALSKFELYTLWQENIHPFSRYQHFSLPWYQISVLCVEVSCGDDLEMLRAAAHSLVQCTLKLAKQYGPVWQAVVRNLERDQVVVLPALRSLTLQLGSDYLHFDGSYFLALVCAPQLEYLSLNRMTLALSEAHKFIQLSGCALRGLRLYVHEEEWDPAPPSMADILAMLAAQPSLRHLHIELALDAELDSDYDGYTHKFLREPSAWAQSKPLTSLLDALKSPTLIPNVVCLRINLIETECWPRIGDTSANWSPDHASAFVRVIRGHPSIQRVRVRMNTRRLKKTTLNALKEFRAAGLDVRYEKEDWVDRAGCEVVLGQ